ncbi:MAG: flagellar biosynthesis protein FlhB [Rickettsiaceae bacterium]|nr:flagellar biosynthesis protein FlhB [Rickettsiaceae bacterium]
MAEGEDQDKETKTEEPTQKRLEESLKKGQVVNSKEVTSFFMFLFLTIVAMWAIPEIINLIGTQLHFFIENAGNIKFDAGTFENLCFCLLKNTLFYVSPILVIPYIAAIISSFLQHGDFIFSIEPIIPKLSKLSPIQGFKRIFSLKSVVEFLKGIFKITLIGVLLYLVIIADVKELTLYQELSIKGILQQLKEMISHILILVTMIMAIIAIADFSYQKYDHYTNLKMTRQEVKEEYKQTEGNPEVKQKIKKLRMEQLDKHIKKTVPQSTVVITNPTHYAIALKYDPNSNMVAPICTAKGLDFIAEAIKELAKEHGIPIVENPPLARELYKKVKVNDEIPVEHYEVVAKIISYVMSLNKEKKQ